MATLSRCLVAVALLISFAAAHEIEGGGKHFHCTKEGRFGDPEDCGSFLDCIPDKKGGLTARHGSCRGRAFDPDTKTCVDLRKADGCKPRTARSLNSDLSLSHICEGTEDGFICADCKTLVNCVNGIAYPEPCSQGDFCATNLVDFGGDVCYPDKPEECMCEKPHSFKRDPYETGRFLFCEKEASDPVIYHCPDDHYFNSTISQCVNTMGLPDCEKIGVFAVPADCNIYYTCIFTTTGWVQKPFSCNEGLMYNEHKGRCENPCNWDDGTFTCQKEGRFPDPLNCNRYYECVADESYEGGLRQTGHECPEGYIWDRSARNDFGHCVLEGTNNTTCLPHMPEKCRIPSGYCDDTVEGSLGDEIEEDVTNSPATESPIFEESGPADVFSSTNGPI
ncbi:uncharacterized protein [Palaemon carinicauda]|uniref:uncharacterized protein isoform X2 n=1 Tax=Palaemon carinicauda TaxID=392227 RepID=UPI0035B5B941